MTGTLLVPKSWMMSEGKLTCRVLSRLVCRKSISIWLPRHRARCFTHSCSFFRAILDGLDESNFTEGHELDRKTTKQVPKAMIGRRLSQEEAKRLLAKFD
jgi:hypothetical protein